MCRKLDGGGTITATGGNGLSEGGGGGGGRVAVWRVYHPFTGMASVTNGTCTPYAANKGEIGTLIWGQSQPGGAVLMVR